jgi:hypothetical protein
LNVEFKRLDLRQIDDGLLVGSLGDPPRCQDIDVCPDSGFLAFDGLEGAQVNPNGEIGFGADRQESPHVIPRHGGVEPRMLFLTTLA